MDCRVGENLCRLMATQGLSSADVAQRTGLDPRTIRAIRDGRHKPQPRTVHRLAAGLGVPADEFFLDPVRLLHRRFDRATNPVVDEVLGASPQLFKEWTEGDFDELYSRVGRGGPLTAAGVAAAAAAMNAHRSLHDMLDVLLESSQSETVRGVLETLYRQVVVAEPPRG